MKRGVDVERGDGGGGGGGGGGGVDSFLLFHSSTTFTACVKNRISFIEKVFGEKVKCIPEVQCLQVFYEKVRMSSFHWPVNCEI